MARTARHSKEAWLDTGLSILSRKGRKALTLQELVERMDMTKGAFYHHFADFGEYRKRLLDHFAQVGTHRLIAFAESHADPRTAPADVLETLVRESGKGDDGAERVLRAWALEDAEVRLAVERVDRARMVYGRKLFLAMTGDRAAAARMIRMLYALLLGAEQLDRSGPKRVRAAVFAEFKALYGIR